LDPRRRVSGRQEKDSLKRYNAQGHAGSGSGWMRRNDGHTTEYENRAVDSGFLFEFKTVIGGQKQITVKKSDLEQVEKEAVLQGRTPVLQVEIAGRRYVILTDEDFQEKFIDDNGAQAPNQV
jgi:hypothetical protein